MTMTEPSLTLAPDALVPADGDDRGPTRWLPIAGIGDAEPVVRCAAVAAGSRTSRRW